MRAQAGKFTLCADGLCIGFDSADGVSEEFKGSSPFKGGTILGVGVSHEKKQYLNLEREIRERLHGISGQFNFESDVTGSPNGLPVMVIANSRKQERFGEIAFRPAMLALAPEAIRGHLLKYVWQLSVWPELAWQSDSLLAALSQARLAQGKLLTKVTSLGFDHSLEAHSDILTEEVITTSAIEGKKLDRESVRSSVARRLGLPVAGLPPIDRAVDGLVEVLLEATRQYDKPLTATRLKRWQAGLFPTGWSGISKIHVGKWRPAEMPMRVVSGTQGRERIHYEAPPGYRVEEEMRQFLAWWTSSLGQVDGLLRSGLAHFYFVTIHPFEDGNGRLARALTDMALAQDEKLSTRYYSLSSQIMEERKDYYDVLGACQKGSGDVTSWLKWYLECSTRAVERAEKLIGNVLSKARFWQDHSHVGISERQRKVVNRLLDAGKEGFQGGLTTRKYVSMAEVSRATAFREISELLEKGILIQNPARGRSVSYDLRWS